MKGAIEILRLRPNELDKFQGLISVFEIAFEMKNFRRPGNLHLQKILAKDGFIAIVALQNNNVIGGLTIYMLDQYYSEKPLAYVYDVAVLPEYQRKGVGKKLIKFTNEFCKQMDFYEVFVQAEKEDGYVIDFYRLTNPSREGDVVQFSYLLTDENDIDTMK